MTRDNRKKVTAQVHIARKQLGLDEETYREVIALATGGKRSCADCTVAELYQVLQHMKDRGFKARPRKRVAQHPGTPHNLNREPMLQKVEALLAELKAPWSYADAIARQQTGIARVAWLKKPADLKALIAALDVELEKRSKLTALERQLEAHGLTTDDVEKEFPTLRENWRRHRGILDRLAEHYAERGA